MDENQPPHYCTGCGDMHGGEARESPEVAIARINREADIKIARINAHQDQDWNETRVEVAEVEAAAEVESAVATAETVVALTGAAGETPEAEEPPAVVVEAPAAETEIEEPSIMPKDDSGGEPPAPKSKGFSYWP
jgi:hypothetical protein